MPQVNNIFTAKINNKSQSDMYQEIKNLPSEIVSYNEREELINALLNDDADFIMEYFNTFYDCHLTGDSELSTENNVCQLTERMANYLLTSTESKEMNKDEGIFLYNEEDILKKTARESVGAVENGEIKNITDLNYFTAKHNQLTMGSITNFKKIDKSGLKDKNKQENNLIKEYKLLLTEIDRQLKLGMGNRRKLTLEKSRILKDIDIVTDYVQKIYYSNPSIPTDFPLSVSDVDFTNEEIVKVLLTMSVDDSFDEGFRAIIWSFDSIISRAHLNEQEMKIKALMKNGYNITEIGKILEVEYRNLYRNTIPNMINKIVSISLTRK